MSLLIGELPVFDRPTTSALRYDRPTGDCSSVDREHAARVDQRSSERWTGKAAAQTLVGVHSMTPSPTDGVTAGLSRPVALAWLPATGVGREESTP